MTVSGKVGGAGLPLFAFRVLSPTSHCRADPVASVGGWADLDHLRIGLDTCGLAIRAGAVHAAPPHADPRARAWHAYRWDPWFLLWGLFVIVALVSCSSPRFRGH